MPYDREMDTGMLQYMNIAKPNETEDIYQKNIGLLTPCLKEAVRNVSEQEFNEKIKVTYNTEGYPVCLYRSGNNCFHITSEHAVKEADSWVSNIEIRDSAEIFLYGCGFGYALFELFAAKPPQTLVVVYECDVCLFKAMLYYFDLEPLIQTQKIVFIVGSDLCVKKQLLDLFGTILFNITTFPAVIFTFSAARNFKKEYLEIHRAVFEELAFLTSCIGNSHQDDMIGLHNLLANTKQILESPYVSSMKDKYKGIAAVIVSNGPSLDKSMPLLKQIQGRCLMVCAESASIPLKRNGIKPDIIAALERTKTNYNFHFENQNHSRDVALFALGMVDPRTFSSFEGEKIPIFRKGEGLNRWFNRYIGDGSELDSGASVAHLALSTAIYLGADPIIFVGQDLAYGADGVTHSKDAVVMQEKGERIREIIQTIPTTYVEGNSGEMILSNQLWVNFKFIMESIISKHPEHRFYNATEGGAKIQGTERATLPELIEQYCGETLPQKVTEMIAQEREKVSLAERAVLLDKMVMDIEHYTETFRNISYEANLKKLECERMMILCAGKNEESYQDIIDETYKSNLAVIYRYRNDELCGFFSQRLLCAYFYLFNRLGVIDTKLKRAQIFDLHKQFFCDLRAVTQSLAVTFEEAAPALKAVREELNDKAVANDESK